MKDVVLYIHAYINVKHMLRIVFNDKNQNLFLK